MPPPPNPPSAPSYGSLRPQAQRTICQPISGGGIIYPGTRPAPHSPCLTLTERAFAYVLGCSYSLGGPSLLHGAERGPPREQRVDQLYLSRLWSVQAIGEPSGGLE